MPQANLLACTQLKRFKAWLEAKGHEWREGRGDYQVIQVQLAGQTDWHVVYYRECNQVHYSVPNPLVPTVEQFLKDKNRNANRHPTPRKQAGQGRTRREKGASPPAQNWFSSPLTSPDADDPDRPF